MAGKEPDGSRFYHTSDRIRDKFYQFPMVLLEDNELYGVLSSDALVIYAILRNRIQSSLSEKNVQSFSDQNGRVFCYFRQQELADAARVSLSTARRSLKQLADCELIYKVKQGLNLPDRIYLLIPKVRQLEEIENDKSETPEEDYSGNQPQPAECSNLPVGEVKKNSPDCSERTVLVNKKEKNKKSLLKSPSSSPQNEQREEMLEEIKTQIDYNSFTATDLDVADRIVDIIADVMSYSGSSFRINKSFYQPAESMKTVFKRVNRDAVMYTLEALGTAGRIHNFRSYTISVLFNYLNTPEIKKQPQKPKNNFCDFEQRQYDNDFYKKIMEAQGQ